MNTIELNKESGLFEYSVALCTYNGVDYIEEQLNSILNQTIKPSEIIISDDGSQDETLRRAKALLDLSDIRYLIVENHKGRGVANNFANAISLCRCPFIFTSDQDDVWVDIKAESIRDSFYSNPDAMMVFSNGYLVDKNLNYLNADMWESINLSERMLREADWFNYLLNRPLVTGAAMAFKRELFDEKEGIPDYWLHDSWLSMKAAVLNGLVACNKKLIMYRQHNSNVVGMKSGFFQKTKGFLSGFKEMRQVHVSRFKRFDEAKNLLSMNDSQVDKINRCIGFWQDLMESDNEPKRKKRIRTIRRHVKNRDFDRYFNGRKGAAREYLLALFC